MSTELDKILQYKTAGGLSRHPAAVMRKIREVIENSLASKRPLLRSSSPLACAGELSSRKPYEPR